jgi:hypothetical protein
MILGFSLMYLVSVYPTNRTKVKPKNLTSLALFAQQSLIDTYKWTLLTVQTTAKLLSAEVKNSQIILRIVLPIVTKFLKKSQICRALLQEVAKQSTE